MSYLLKTWYPRVVLNNVVARKAYILLGDFLPATQSENKNLIGNVIM